MEYAVGLCLLLLVMLAVLSRRLRAVSLQYEQATNLAEEWHKQAMAGDEALAASRAANRKLAEENLRLAEEKRRAQVMANALWQHLWLNRHRVNGFPFSRN